MTFLREYIPRITERRIQSIRDTCLLEVDRFSVLARELGTESGG